MAKRTLPPYAYTMMTTPIAMVSTIDGKGRRNIVTLAWVGVLCSEPPTVGISIRPGKYSHDQISQSQEFVVNIPTEDLAAEMEFCGKVSGWEVDKWEKSGLTPVPAQKVRAPLIAECPINLECVVKRVIPLGVHHLFIAEVVNAHVDEAVLDNEGRVDVLKVKPLLYFARDYWTLKGQVVVPPESHLPRED